MKKSAKSLVLITIVSSVFNSSNAQSHLSPVNGIGNDIKKVIDDYPNRFNILLARY